MRRVTVCAVLMVLVFAACGEDQPDQAAPVKVAPIAIEAADYKFVNVPQSAESGVVEVSLANGGKEPHQAQLFKLGDGIEIGQLVEEGKKAEPERNFAPFGTWAGGPNAVDPKEAQSATVQLEVGRYAFFCQVPDAKGQAHLGLGMMAPLEVTHADEEAEAPSVEYSSSAKEFGFVLPETWKDTIAFENRGEQPHELQIIGVAEGKTPEDVEAWFKADPGEAGPPSWTTGGGVSAIEPGETASFEGQVEPGTYFAMCFVADPEKKAPHFALGMMQRFEVKE